MKPDFPVGFPTDACVAKRPERRTLRGRYTSLVPLDAATHADSLWSELRAPENQHLWTWLFNGPYTDREAFVADLTAKAASNDPLFFAIIDHESGGAIGYASYLRVEPAHRCVEVGNILFAPRLQRTRGATEAMYLMARHVFDDLGYRRYEWKCDALNAPSRRAALRLGYTFEGVFRQHMIVKGRNRDTAWYAMLDTEWPARKEAFERWLAPENFETDGRQRMALERPA